MIHISQVMNGRLALSRATKKVNGTKAMVDLARWMSGKPVIIDQLEWRHRPWEIEACHWQTILLMNSDTCRRNQPDQQLQKTGKKHLALFKAALPVPQVVRANPEPHLDMMDAPATMSPGPAPTPLKQQITPPLTLLHLHRTAHPVLPIMRHRSIAAEYADAACRRGIWQSGAYASGNGASGNSAQRG